MEIGEIFSEIDKVENFLDVLHNLKSHVETESVKIEILVDMRNFLYDVKLPAISRLRDLHKMAYEFLRDSIEKAEAEKEEARRAATKG